MNEIIVDLIGLPNYGYPVADHNWWLLCCRNRLPPYIATGAGTHHCKHPTEMEDQALSPADALHQDRVSAFISAYDGAGDQANRFQVAKEYRDIFALSSDQASARARLFSSGAISLLTGLIIGDAAHRIVRQAFGLS